MWKIFEGQRIQKDGWQGSEGSQFKCLENELKGHDLEKRIESELDKLRPQKHFFKRILESENPRIPEP
ncbi:hypothetical protein B9Z55_009238 [Caenorhabditis nigoni]|uniref:Uncharacterized protein n=1 Tax=Caenorhabditis nigoni TaxID=1611254 RepID=A0A2G5UR86_9PELO|nr:hypothetical protein B9Z55_009238 [Caenorhabditis nigoni]